MNKIFSPRIKTAFSRGFWLSTPVIMGGVMTVFFLGPAAERVYIVFLISLIAVLGMGIYSGNSGILSFGHLAFMAIGAYVSGVLTLPVNLKKLTLPHLPDMIANLQIGLLSSFLAAIVIVSIVAWLAGRVMSRLEGSAASIATLGFLIIVHGVIIAMREFTRGSQSFFGVPRDVSLWLCLVFGVLVVIFSRIFRDAVWGLQLRAARDDMTAAQSIGIDVKKRRLQAWVLSAIPVAIAGVLLAHFLGTFSPKKFYFQDTFALLAMLIIGGMASVSGAMFGTILITFVTEFLRRIEGGIDIFGFKTAELFGTTQIGIGLAILFVMYRRPDGLFGRFEIDELWWKQSLEKQPQTREDWEKRLAIEPSGQLYTTSITKNFSGLRALDQVRFSMKPGEIVGLIGPNGSGKTTLLNILSGVLRSSTGQVMIDDTDVTNDSSHQIARQHIARTFQNIRLFKSLTVMQNVEVAALSAGSVDSTDANEFSQAILGIMELDQDSHRLATTLPYGAQRRVEIARALAVNPRYLLLDEPAAGMNSEESRQLLEQLQSLKKNLGIGLLVIDHDMEVIMGLCDRILVLNEGHLIAEGPPDEIKRNPTVIEAYMGRKYAEQMSKN